jgi:hypothetical protein
MPQFDVPRQGDVTPAACPRCGAPTHLAARFCRQCGSSLAANPMSATTEAAPPPPVAETATVAAPRRPASSPPVAETVNEPRPKRPSEPVDASPRTTARRSHWLAIAGRIAAVFAIAAGVTFALSASHHKTAGRAGEAAKSGTPTPTARAPAATATPAPSSPSAGRFVRLGSFRFQSAAQREVAALQAKGITAKVISSDDTEGMFPAFFQVIEGPVSGTDERRALRAAKRAGVAGPFVKELEPIAGARPPARELAGNFDGWLQQTNAKVKRLNRTLATTMSFAADGRGGTISYVRPRCQGTLTRATGHGHSFAFREVIQSGRCTSGGTWHVRLENGQLWATWWRPDDVTFVIGTLDR